MWEIGNTGGICFATLFVWKATYLSGDDTSTGEDPSKTDFGDGFVWT